MLRLWKVNTVEGAIWRASLESPHTGERYAFADLAELFDFLQGEAERLGDESPPDVFMLLKN